MGGWKFRDNAGYRRIWPNDPDGIVMKTIRVLIGFNVGGCFAIGWRPIPPPTPVKALDAARSWKEWEIGFNVSR